jgi:collagen type IV alpha
VGTTGSRAAAGSMVALLGFLCVAGSAAAAVSVEDLPAEDRKLIQNILEFERTNVRRELPVSGHAVTVVRTVTSPRVCRTIRIEEGDEASEATGCRAGRQQWTFDGAAAVAIAEAPRPGPAPPRAEPVIVARSAPIPDPADAAEYGGEPGPEVAALPEPAVPVPPAARDAPTSSDEIPAAVPPRARAPFTPPRPEGRPRIAAYAAVRPDIVPLPLRRRSTPEATGLPGSLPRPMIDAVLPQIVTATLATVTVDPGAGSRVVLDDPPTVPRPDRPPRIGRQAAAVPAAVVEPASGASPPVPAAAALPFVAVSPVPAEAPPTAAAPGPVAPGPVVLGPVVLGPVVLAPVDSDAATREVLARPPQIPPAAPPPGRVAAAPAEPPAASPPAAAAAAPPTDAPPPAAASPSGLPRSPPPLAVPPLLAVPPPLTTRPVPPELADVPVPPVRPRS